jgi:hypothetical protein
MRLRRSYDWAKYYLSHGWQVVLIPGASKVPRIKGWESLRITSRQISRYFYAGDQNIGVLLGVPSNLLVDVDLDHPLAVDLAARFLPKTPTIFGRISKPSSHWIYYLTEPAPTKQWRLPNRKNVVLELRSTGSQTVFPGSHHPSGEPIHWETFGEPS